jgi:hypothetical protein
MGDASSLLSKLDSAVGNSPADSGPSSSSVAPSSSLMDKLQAGSEGKFTASEADKPYETTARSLGMNALARANETLASTLGAPVDVVNAGLRKVGLPVSEKPVMGSEWIKSGMGLIHANPDDVQPHNEAERIAGGIGGGAASAVLLPLGGEALAAGKVISPAAAATTRAALGAPDALNATIGGASGAGSTIAADAVPEPYKPLAAVGGGLVGGLPMFAGHAAVEGARGAVNAVTDRLTEEGAKRVVGREMAAAATDQAAARENLATQPHEIVPGSVGTTGQVAGDTGLLNWERGVRQQNPAEFNNREAAQNSAQIAHLESVQPEGNAADLPGVIAGQREAAAKAAQTNTGVVEALSNASVKSAEAAHKSALEGLQSLGPDASPAEVSSYFRSVRDAIEAQHDTAVSAAEKQAEKARSATTPKAQTPEEIGQNLRTPAEEARATAKDATDKLYAALPKNIEAPTAEVAVKAKEIRSGMLPEHAPMAGEEARLFDLAKNYGDNAPLANLNALRSSILSEKANVKRTNPQAFGRLTQLQGAVENAIDHGIESRVALDQVAVRRGTMAAEDALPARLNEQINDAVRQQAAVEVRGGSNGSGAGRSEGGNASGPGSESQADVGSGNAASGEGLSPPPGGNPASADGSGGEGVSPLRQANAAYKDLKQTFDQGPVGDITGKNGRGEYDLSPAELTKKVFHPGDTGGEDVRAYVKAVGEEKANPALTDAAAASLHAKALRLDGTLDPKKIDSWLADHKTAIAELPDAVKTKFQNAAKAQRAVEDAFAARLEAKTNYEKSEAGKLMGLEDPGDITRKVGGIITSKDGAKRMGELAQGAKGNPAAEQGLQRAVVEHVMDKFLPEHLEKAQAFIKDKADVLGKVFTPEQIDGIAKKIEAAQTAGERVAGAKAGREVALKEAQASEKEALSRYDATVLGKIMKTEGKANVLDKLGTVFASSDSAKQMGLLAEEAAKVEGGTTALRKAVTEMIQRDYSTTAEVATSGEKGLSRAGLDKFMKENTETLEKVLSPEQVGKLRAIIEDQLRANRSITASKLKGGSDTAQNQIATAKTGGSIMSMISKHLAESGATIAGAVVGGPAGALAGQIGSKAMSALRDAGLNKVSEIRIRAALDPQFGKALLDEVPKYPDRNAAALIALRARQLSVAGAIAGSRQ